MRLYFHLTNQLRDTVAGLTGAEIAAGRKQYLDGFSIGFDNWHSTDGPENHQLAQDIYLALRKEGLIAVSSGFTAAVRETFSGLYPYLTALRAV